MTHGETILLRLLARRDMHGYELDHIIEENRMRQWADIGFSSIYNILNKLERKGLVESYYVKGAGAPRRKVYRITSNGRRALREAVLKMLAQPAQVHDDFAVGLVTSDVLSDEEFRSCLKAYRVRLIERKHLFEHEIPERSREKERVALAIERVGYLLDAEIRWLDKQQPKG
jgi:DNA-binding PadR family transcriptional regulator